MMRSEAARPGETPGVAARMVALARARPGISFVALLCLAGLLYAGFVLLWPSDRRRVTAVVAEVVDGLVERDVEGVMSHVSPYFSEEGIDRELLRNALGRILRRPVLDRAHLATRRLVIDDGEAVLRLHVTSFHGGVGVRFARSEWRVKLEEIRGEWLVRSATPLRVNDRRIAGLRGVLALGL